ncbi:MAG: hypothetical protein ACLF0P_17170 [Thermoanaerobaculia bacterium]
MKVKIALFLAGVLVGGLLAALFRPLIEPAVRNVLNIEEASTEGRVVAKRMEGERLLLTVDGEEGTVLATFTSRVPEIDLLVEEGDQLRLGVDRYEPFVEDPDVLAVHKRDFQEEQRRAERDAEEAPPEEPAGAPEPGDRETARFQPEPEPEPEPEPYETEADPEPAEPEPPVSPEESEEAAEEEEEPPPPPA